VDVDVDVDVDLDADVTGRSCGCSSTYRGDSDRAGFDEKDAAVVGVSLSELSPSIEVRGVLLIGCLGIVAVVVLFVLEEPKPSSFFPCAVESVPDQSSDNPPVLPPPPSPLFARGVIEESLLLFAVAGVGSCLENLLPGFESFPLATAAPVPPSPVTPVIPETRT
jgi:hypothetical protein